MNIVLITTNLAGGAGGAARRLHLGLRNAGVKSSVVTRERRSGVPGIVPAQGVPGSLYARARRNADRLPKLLYPGRDRTRSFDPQWLPDRLSSRVARLAPDVINPHWVCTGFLGIDSIARFRAPIVWSMHDMWPFTGGCFYSEECDRYTRACGTCPILGAEREGDLSRRTWQRKVKAWKNVDLTLVAPSSWLESCARSSSLFGDRPVRRIPYGIDLERFKAVDRLDARKRLGLPPDRRFALFAAWGDRRRKGVDVLEAAMGRLAMLGRGADLDLVTCGTAGGLAVSGVRSHHLGQVDEASMPLVYSAVDVTVVPSTWEALGYVALESIACGTPVVAFDAATGLPDVVDHLENGYLARAFEPEDLAQGILWTIEDKDRHDVLSRNAHAKAVNEFSVERQIRSYVSLFDEVIERSPAAGAAG